MPDNKKGVMRKNKKKTLESSHHYCGVSDATRTLKSPDERLASKSPKTWILVLALPPVTRLVALGTSLTLWCLNLIMKMRAHSAHLSHRVIENNNNILNALNFFLTLKNRIKVNSVSFCQCEISHYLDPKWTQG